MRPGIKVKDIANSICMSNDKKELSRTIERIRYWSRFGWIKPLGEKSTGTGTWRTYPPGTIYLAAVLEELSKYTLPPEVLGSVSTYLKITLMIGDSTDLAQLDIPEVEDLNKREVAVSMMMQITKAVDGDRTVFMTLAKNNDATDIAIVSRESYTLEDIGSVIVLNVTSIFKRVSDL